MTSFEDFYKELISDTRWFELLRNYKESTIKACAQKVYDEIVTLKTLGSRTIEENRLHVYRVCKKGPEDKPKGKPFEVKEEVKDEWQPVSWDKRAEYLDKLQEIIKGSTMANGVPRPSRKEQAEEGLDRPKKMPPYPITSKEEFYAKQRHLEYIKQNYEPRTGLKKPAWVEEDLFNVLYDEKNFDAYWKQFEKEEPTNKFHEL